MPTRSRQAIFGAAPLPCGAESTIGFPIRIASPRVLRGIVAELARFTPEEISAHDDPRAMVADSVYRMREDKGAEYLASLLESFASLRDMYGVAAERDEHVVVSFN
jgi:hypothetical protein